MIIKPKTLIITSTHGDELVGLEVVKELLKGGYGDQFDFIVANPYALKENKRFIDCDLNRSYPGSEHSDKLEEVLACKNMSIASEYDYVIDLHEAKCGSDNFIIIPRKDLTSDFPLNLINLKTILHWPEPKGPLGGFLPNVIELEFGMLNKDRKEVISSAVSVCEGFMVALKNGANGVWGDKNVYEVYDSLKAADLPEYEKHHLEDFAMIKIGDDSFYPLLVGQYIDIGIICYKMKKITA